MKFESLEQLKAEIGKDGDFCRMSLEIPSLAAWIGTVACQLPEM